MSRHSRGFGRPVLDPFDVASIHIGYIALGGFGYTIEEALTKSKIGIASANLLRRGVVSRKHKKDSKWYDLCSKL
jgi:hypothetical protein